VRGAPCTVSAEEVREGLSILDGALAVADRYYRADAGLRSSKGQSTPDSVSSLENSSDSLVYNTCV
jgi:hypothetical protein